MWSYIDEWRTFCPMVPVGDCICMAARSHKSSRLVFFDQSWCEERSNCLLFNPNSLNLMFTDGVKAEWTQHYEEWNSVSPIASKRRDSERIIRVPSEIKSKLSEHGIKKKIRSNTREDPRSSFFAQTVEPLTTLC